MQENSPHHGREATTVTVVGWGAERRAQPAVSQARGVVSLLWTARKEDLLTGS